LTRTSIPPISLVDAFDEALHRVRVGHVRAEDLVWPSAQGSEYLLRRLTVGAVVNGHPRAFCRELARYLAPYAARRARYQRHLPQYLHSSPFLVG
jgi:hypothetical protein